jgi:hypothetical protein
VEGIQESLKNMLLVMSADNLLVQPTEDAKESNLWTSTWAVVGGFHPNLQHELFPVETVGKDV